MLEINLKSKVALVTGVADELGVQICLRLAEAGAKVWAHQNYENVEVYKTLNDHYFTIENKIETVIGNLKTPESVQTLIGEILERHGKIDILINCSELVSSKSLSDITPEEWLTTFEVNLDVPFLCCQEVIPSMVGLGKGTIVNISSQAAKTGEIGPHYAATKSALESMTKGLSNEFGDFGIRVNNVSPSVKIHNENQTLNSLQSMRAAVADVILVLCSPLTECINGESIMIGEV